MKTFIKIYDDIVAKIKFFSKQLHLKLSKSTGRPLAISGEEIISMALFKQQNGIETIKATWKIFDPKCSYKTLVVNMKRFAVYTLLIVKAIFKWNQRNSHLIKHTDATDIPVCLNKNAKKHKTMEALASWGHSGKGFYYGLKMTITTDLRKKMLGVKFSSSSADDREIFKDLNKEMEGIFVADAGYLSKDLEKEFHIENKRFLFSRPRANMKKVATQWYHDLYTTRMQIELNFRSLKMFHNLVTSLPRTIDGYFANYIYSLLAYMLG